jgi:hypothetical protein
LDAIEKIEPFVLFRPKDVVSGDFYWMSKTSQFNFVAVEQRRLSGAVWPDQPGDGALFNPQRRAIHGMKAAEMFVKVVNDDHVASLS